MNIGIAQIFQPWVKIIYNPPYQMSDGGNNASAAPLYHLFVEQALKLNPKYMTMIIPARWYAGGKGLDTFRNDMLKQSHIKELVDIPNSADCFPGVNIAGGICYFLWDRTYEGDCTVINKIGGNEDSRLVRPLKEYDYFVRSNTALSIIHKVTATSKMMSDIVFSRNYFNIPTKVTGDKTSRDGDVQVLTSKGIIYLPPESVSDKQKLLGKYKVIITYAMSGGNKPSSDGNYQVLSSLKVLGPNEAATETYLILGVYDSKEEAEHMVQYASTKFFRFLLLQALSSIHITKDKFCFVPVQDMQEEWSDEKLFVKYNLSQNEQEIIESTIKPMDLNGGDT